MAPVTEEDILQAIRSMKRHKSGGLDSLNNDFYKDFPEHMAEVLVDVFNDILRGDKPPPSFLESLVIPLRKKGDSTDAMDYRPIMLLQSSYKILASILAARLQRFLHRLIGYTQQGFVLGRQLCKSVTMMLAYLNQAYFNPKESADDSPGILLLDFQKACDSVDRNYMLQYEAVALARRSKPELKIEGICFLQVISVFKQPRQCEPSPTRQTRSLRVHFDGGSRGNPGTGRSVANNYCEVNALRLGLAAAKCSGDPGTSVIEVIGDSQLLIIHFTGSAVIRNPNLAAEITEINRILRGFNGIHWQLVKRNFNKAADSLANIAIDAKSSGRFVGNVNQLLTQRRDQVLKLLAVDHTYHNRPRKPVLLGRLIDFRES